MTHNEVVLDNLAMQPHMPGTIEAFFFMSQRSRGEAARLHQNFLVAFNLTFDDVPLLELRLDAEEPFRHF